MVVSNPIIRMLGLARSPGRAQPGARSRWTSAVAKPAGACCLMIAHAVTQHARGALCERRSAAAACQCCAATGGGLGRGSCQIRADHEPPHPLTRGSTAALVLFKSLSVVYWRSGVLLSLVLLGRSWRQPGSRLDPHFFLSLSLSLSLSFSLSPSLSLSPPLSLSLSLECADRLDDGERRA